MKAKFLLLASCFLFFSLIASAQKKTVQEFHVSEADINNDETISKRFKLSKDVSASFKLEVLETEILPKGTVEMANVAEDFAVTGLVSKERKVPYAIATIPAYRKKGEQIERLVKYQLELTETPVTVGTAARPTDVSTSVLASGNWYKIAIDKRGVYKIDYAMLESMGLTPSSVNPANIRIYGNGGSVLPETISDETVTDLVENSIFVSSTGSSFAAGDYILFYADGPVKWEKNSSGDGFVHTANYYENNSYYFLNADIGPGKRVETETATGTGDVTLDAFDGYTVVDVDSFNPGTMGKTWWSHSMYSSSSGREHNLNVNLGSLDGPVKLESRVGGTFDADNNKVNVSVDGTVRQTINLNSLINYEFMKIGQTESTFSPSSGNMSVKISLTPVGNGTAYLDYLRFNAREKLTMEGSTQLNFRDLASAILPATQSVQYRISNAGAALKVWEVTDPLQPTALTGSLSAGKYSVVRPAGTLREFISFDGTSFGAPTFIGKVENQNLHGMEQVDLLIITRSDFVPIAEDLANFHREKDGMKVEVVTVDKIYNEFSSGGQDISGIRNFIKMFYDRATDESDMIKNVLLFGAASYDYKERIASNTNIVPVYQTLASTSGATTYSSDDFYSLMDEGERLEIVGALLDIGVGRIPVRNTEQARQVVDKIKGYAANTSFGPWKNTFMFVSDNYDNGWATSHTADADKISRTLKAASPLYNHIKLYGDVYPVVATPSGNKLPALTKALNDQIFLGSFLVNYSGHGAPNRLAAEDIMTLSDINSWTNLNKLPVIVTATCNFGRFDDPGFVSGGVLAFLKPNGGSIASVTTTQLVYASSNLVFNTNYTANQFNRKEDGSWRTLGEALRDGKNANGAGATQNNAKYALLGDPALTLALPQYNVATDSLLAYDGEGYVPADTIKALGRYALKGSIKDGDNDHLLSDFNGTVYVTIYDKAQTVPVVNDPALPDISSYEAQTNVLYKGQATVTNGTFSVSFVVPKDINYDFGKGKIIYYADNGMVDAAGADTFKTVGGFSSEAVVDNDGPVVEPFIDSDKFRNGGVTGPDPLLFVKLADENGINVSGSSVGHDLIGILDGDAENPYVLNNYYQTAPDDYSKGTVSFPLSGIAVGKHTLQVRAWDTYNNSGEGQVEFEVVAKEEGAIGEVYNYPNPFSDHTTFVVQHNQSKTDMVITIQIFNNSGSLVKTLEQPITTTGNRTEIEWDGRSENAYPMSNGLYFYRVNLKTSTGISATAYQKLVLLR